MPASEGTRLITPASGGTSAYQYVPDGIKDDIEEPMEISMYDNDLASGTPPSNEGFFCSSGASKSFVFGGYDGVLASLIVLSAAVGGGMTNRAVLAVGFATVIASALSIGITEYRSSKAHQDFLQAEKRRELWEFKHCRDKEMSSMVTRLERRGMSRADAQVVVSKMAQYENVFVNLMVVEDLGLQISDEDEQLFFVDAFMMFLSFGVMGLLPIVVFWLSSMLTLSRLEVFSLALVFAIVLLGVLGMIKSSFSSSSSVYSVVEAVILGTFCSAVSFAIGFIIQAL